MTSQAPAGWYPQPDGTQRYWDGQQWTDHIAPGAGVAAQANASEVPSVSESLPSAEPSPAAATASVPVPVATTSVAIDKPADARPWWKKKRFIIPGAALILVVVVAALSSGGEGGPEDLPTSTPNSTATPSPSASATASASPTPTATATAVADVEIPDLVGLSVVDATAVLEELGLVASPNTETPNAVVTSSSPASGALVFTGATVILEAKEPPLDTSDFKSLSNRNYARLLKSPDNYIGEQYVLYGIVTQFDAATGECQFRADTSNKQQSDWYDYDDNVFYISGDGISDCPLLGDVLQDDHVKLYVTSLGSYSYDTQAGGSTTVPLFEVEKVKQLKSVD